LQGEHFNATFTPAIEVGWLLPHEQWGQRLGDRRHTRGARLRISDTLKLNEVVAITAECSILSQRSAAQRLGLTHDRATTSIIRHTMGTALRRCALCRPSRKILARGGLTRRLGEWDRQVLSL
jgi:hypothetical protein